jgi:FixJ family two-component response regulator
MPQTPHATPRVFVIDADPSLRESLELLIQRSGWQTESCSCAQQFLSKPRAHVPSCLVMDVAPPDIHGLELQQRLIQEGEDMPIIFIAGCADVPTTVRAMKAGAADFLTKPIPEDRLLASIADAIERNRAALQHREEVRALEARYASLTRREREVMALVVSGRLNKQAAGDLGISEITVKTHRGNVMRKMNARSFASLVSMALRMTSTAALRA